MNLLTESPDYGNQYKQRNPGSLRLSGLLYLVKYEPSGIREEIVNHESFLENLYPISGRESSGIAQLPADSLINGFSVNADVKIGIKIVNHGI